MSTVSSALQQFKKSSKNNYPFLRFDAYSMKDLINKKLSEDSEITDHLYDGSNISIFVDIISTMFESLMFNLNNSASECMISDANIYGNLSRLVKFLGYSPSGYKASTVNVTINSKSKDLSFLVIPKYSTITLKDVDSFGNAIAFSTTDYYYMNAGRKTTIKLVNGTWKKYPNTFTATGEPYEKFVLSNLVTDTETDSNVAYPYIDVYVKRPIGNGKYNTIAFTALTDTLYFNETDDSILDSNDNYFALRLNENKEYEIEFGDGVHGSILKEGDIINIVYLKSNNEYGCIEANDISNAQFKVKIDGLSNSIDNSDGETLTLANVLELDSTYSNSIFAYSSGNPYGNENIIGEYINDSDESYNNRNETFFYGCTNEEKSSEPTVTETVEQIRENAPNHFKRSGRVNTANDFTTAIKERFYQDIVDCVTMNNIEYKNTFHKWLWRLGTDKCNNPRKWLNPSLSSLGTYGYKYSDASDSNNVYVWIKQESECLSTGTSIINDLKDECPLTANIVVVQAVDEKFAICAGMTDTYNNDGTKMTLRDYYNGSTDTDYFYFNDNGQNRLEVTLRSGTNIAETIIKNRILEVFKNFFSMSHLNLGSSLSIGDLEDKILDINGISKVRTVFRKLLPDGTYSSTDIIRRSGVCLVHWNDSIVSGYDIDITNGSVSLEKFQYPIFDDYSKILNQIDVIIDGSTNISEE